MEIQESCHWFCLEIQQIQKMNAETGAGEKQIDAVIYQTATEDFFQYNLIAKEIRDQIIG